MAKHLLKSKYPDKLFYYSMSPSHEHVMMVCSQIRLLMSAAILFASGIIPSQLLDLSLETSFATPLPLAPAEGLILTGSAYARNVNDEVNCVYIFLTHICVEVSCECVQCWRRKGASQSRS